MGASRGSLTPTPSTHHNASSFEDLLRGIPLPQWAIYTIFVSGGLLLLLCLLCICIKCCCKKKEKKKRQKDQLNLKAVNGQTTMTLVQPDVEDVDYGSTKQHRGKLLYSLEHNATKSELSVGIKQANDLKAVNLGRSADPYAKVYIVPDKSKTFETKVFKNTLNPTFNELFTFQLSKSKLLKSTVVIKVLDFNRFTTHTIIGELRVQLCDINWNHVREEWGVLEEPAKFEEVDFGEICFSLRYVPTTSKLTIVILEAKNLRSMDFGGSSDPYVKVQLALDKTKWKKRKTSVKKKTLNPYFNESFTFNVMFDQIKPHTGWSEKMLSDMKLVSGLEKVGDYCVHQHVNQKRVNLVISVWDYDAMTRNDAIGKVFLGCDASGNQLKHWADMLSNPRRPVVQWHSLLSAEQVNSTLGLKKKTPLSNAQLFDKHFK